MVKLLSNINRIYTILLIVLLIVAGIFFPALLTSVAYVIIYIFYALLSLASVIFCRGAFTRALHVLVAFLILCVLCVNVSNDRYPLTLASGGNYLLKTGNDTLSLSMLDFSIRQEVGSVTAVHYETILLINGNDTVTVRVNHPYRYNHVRMYQSSYKSVTPFHFYAGDSLLLCEGQYGILNDASFQFLEYDPVLKRAAVKYNDVLFYLPVGSRSAFHDREIMIVPGTPRIASVLEIVETRGLFLLFVIGGLLVFTVPMALKERKEWK